MSLKDLFRKQNINNIVVTSDNATASAEYVESVATIKAKEKLNDQFVPRINFATASNFAKFGSAELYYEYGFKRIYNEYPYDGTEEEKINFRLSSSYLDDYIFENHYPRTNGYAQFSAVNTTINSSKDGYGRPATPEYILTKGGPHTASGGMIGSSLVSKFDESNYYDPENKMGSSLELNFVNGATVEFWLKKSTWNTATNSKEVVFDLWNNEPSSSSDYGRLTIALSASSNPFHLEFKSGTEGTSRSFIPSGVTTSSYADDNWHHHAFTFVSESQGLTIKYYLDGVKKQTNQTSHNLRAVSTISGNISAIGGLVTDPSGSIGHITGSGKLNAYIDDFRYWKYARTDKQIANNFFIPLAGGNNDYEYNRKLGLYYKFNEGITGTDSIDSTVLDYSGRIANGNWTGYTSSARSTTSAMVESGYARSEFKDPIIYSSHPDVISTLATLTVTGSEQDNYGTSKMMSLLPGWLQEKDRDNYQNQVKKFVQILASYFDNLNAQIGEMNNIFDEDYPTNTEEPYPFAQNLLQSRGFVVPDLFVDGDLVNYLLQKDDNEIFEQNITDVKNRIYHDIYNNLTYILKSKGTEKSFRNLLRCFGIDSEVMRLSLYADDGTYFVQENYEDTSVEKKVLNLNNQDNLTGTIYNVSSSDSSFTYISSSEGSQEEFTAMTVQCEAIFPLHPEKFNDGYFSKSFLTSSIYGFHRAQTASAGNYTWHPTDTDIQVYAVRNKAESKDAYFKLTSSLGFEITSSTYFNLFENNKWNFAFRVRNNKYPYTYGLSGSTGDSYFVEFVGYNSEGNVTKNSFSLSSSVSNAIGKQLLCNSKRLYAGAYRTNFTGSTIQKSDVKIADVKFWQTYLDDETIKYHSYNPNNFGTKTPFRPDNVNTSIEKHELTDLEALALHWRFDTLTTSDSSGEFEGFDFASGSASNASRNSWLGGIVGNKYPFKGEGFVTSSAKAFDRDFIYAAKQRKFGVLMSSDGVTIKNDANTLLFTDDDVSDNFYAFEKSYYGVISEEMVNFFASLVEFNDLIGQPIDGYKRSYKELEKISRIFFEKVESRIEPERFFDFYKWIDSSITFALTQLFPASAKYSETTRNIIESHLLERNKYDRKFPLLIDVTATEGFARGVNELFYNWKFGHAPVDGSENKNCFWQKHRKERSDITDRQTLLDNLNQGNNAKHLGKLQSNGTAYVGSTYALRNFSRLSKFSVQMDKNIHGGVNYGENKNRDIVWDATYIHGPTSQNYPKGIPQNVLAVGLGEGQGTEAFIDCADVETPNEKRKWRLTTVSGRRSATPSVSQTVPRTGKEDYKAIVKGEIAWPINFISASVSTGYQSAVVSKFKEGVVVTNVHSDTYAPGNEIGMQGPFTETWVGGHQSRHVNLNKIKGPSGIIAAATNPTAIITVADTITANDTLTFGDGVLGPDVFTFVNGVNTGAFIIDGSNLGAAISRSNIKTKLEARYNVSITINGNDLEITNNYAGVAGNVTLSETFTSANNTVSGFTGGGPATFRTVNNLDDQYSREEGWRLLLNECNEADSPDGFDGTGSADGAMGFVGPDYGGPYPDTSRKYAVHYREERAKRPVNVKNIRTLTSSARAGNFSENYEVFNTTGRLENRRGSTLTTASVLSPFYDGLPLTTQEASLVGVVASGYGNVTMNFNNTNRIPSDVKSQQVYDPNVRSNSIITSRFSAPGGFETLSEIYLDVPSKEYSAYNALPFRNLTVRGSGSGEAITTESVAFTQEGYGIKYAIGVSPTKGSILSGSTIGQLLGGTGDAFSFSFWAYLPSSLESQHQGYFFEIKDDDHLPNYPTTAYLKMVGSNDDLEFHVNDGSNYNPRFTYNWDNPFRSNLDEWVHVLLTYNGNAGIDAATLYVNSVSASFNSYTPIGSPTGIRAPSDTNSKAAWFNSRTSSAGTFTPYADQLNGIIMDEMSWWTAELSAADAVTLYNSGRPLDLSVGSYTNLLHYWPISSSNDIIATPVDGEIFLEDVVGTNGDITGSKDLDSANQIEWDEQTYNYTITTQKDSIIRLNDIHGNRFGLQTHLRRHSGQFGYDSAVGSETTKESYVTVPSFHKIQRNDMKRLNYSTGDTVVTGTIYNNGFYQSCIPQSDFQYSWITASIGDDLSQRILGFAPSDGKISSSLEGIRGALVFPTASNINIRSL